MAGELVEMRFWAKVDIQSVDGCWLWTAATGSRRNGSVGYGRFGVRAGVGVQAHRFAFELLRGPIPAGLQLDHLCRNTLCVNPAHLEAVTRAENLRRAVAHRVSDVCPQGHVYDEANTIRSASGRRCRQCGRERARRRYLARKPAGQFTGLGSGVHHRLKTRCLHGHPFSEDNTSVCNGERRCLTCHRERERRRRTAEQEVSLSLEN